MEAPRLSRAPSSASSAPSPSTSSSVAARSAACLPCPAHSGHLPAVRAETEALRRLNPPHRAARPRDFTARARAASSAKCNPAGEEGIASTSQLGEFQRGGASREAAGALPAGARARAPAPTCPCGSGECGSQRRAASRVPARRHRLSAHYVMPRHAPAQPTGARAPQNVNTARTWLARPGHVRGEPGRRRRPALRRCREQ